MKKIILSFLLVFLIASLFWQIILPYFSRPSLPHEYSLCSSMSQVPTISNDGKTTWLENGDHVEIYQFKNGWARLSSWDNWWVQTAYLCKAP